MAECSQCKQPIAADQPRIDLDLNVHWQQADPYEALTRPSGAMISSSVLLCSFECLRAKLDHKYAQLLLAAQRIVE